MRIAMMGTGPFAVPTFRWLLQSAHDVPALITRPDHNAHRRRKAPPNPMRAVAEEHDLPVFAPESINSDEAHEILRELDAELFVVCDYGQILSRTSLGLAPRGGINLHGSLLPKYRGAAPINWAMYHGETQLGVSVIHMTPRLDGGPIIAVRSLQLEPHETAVEAERRLAEIGVEAVSDALDRLTASQIDDVIGEMQDAAQVTKAPRLSKDDGAIDWTRTAKQVSDQVRAFQPWPGTYTNLLRDGHEPARLIVNAVSVASDDNAATGEPGQIALVEKDRVLVTTGDGLLSLDRVKPAGKRDMEISEWLRGHALTTNDRFATG